MHRENPSLLFYQEHLRLPTVDRAAGIWLWDTDGNRYLDGCSGAVAAAIGQGDPRVLQALQQQAERVTFAYRTQFENQPAHELAARLTSQLSQDLTRVFYTSGGSEAVEAAIKLARQFHIARGEPERFKVISRYPSYHGSTLGALSATGYGPLNDPFAPLTAPSLYVPAPTCMRCPLGLQFPSCGVGCAAELERVIQEAGPDTVAAFIVEPVGGASTGALVPPAGYLAAVTETCRRHGVIIIYDEVMTGVGRTGAFCAYQHWEDEQPRGAEVDILALSKGLGAGYLPLGAVVCRSEIADSVVAAGGFAHGHTYAGNPLACAVGNAVLQVVEEDSLVENARVRGKQLFAGLEGIRQGNSVVGEVRGLGLLTALEFVADRETLTPFPPELNVHQLVTDLARKQGLLVYPRRSRGGYSGDHILIAPPLSISESELADLLERLAAAVLQLQTRLAAEGQLA